MTKATQCGTPCAGTTHSQAIGPYVLPNGVLLVSLPPHVKVNLDADLTFVKLCCSTVAQCAGLLGGGLLLRLVVHGSFSELLRVGCHTEGCSQAFRCQSGRDGCAKAVQCPSRRSQPRSTSPKHSFAVRCLTRWSTCDKSPGPLPRDSRLGLPPREAHRSVTKTRWTAHMIKCLGFPSPCTFLDNFALPLEALGFPATLEA